MKRIHSLAVAVSALVGGGAAALGGIAGWGGSVTLMNPAANIQIDNWESNTEARIWVERSMTLTTPLSVDALNTGTFQTGSDAIAGNLAVGTGIVSYMLRSDPVGSTASNYQGYVIFDRPVLALMFLRPTLNDSDDLLGKVGITYNRNVDRGLEMDGPNEFVKLSADRLRVDFFFATGAYTDDVRIITTDQIPSPAAVGLFALAGMWKARRTRFGGPVEDLESVKSKTAD